VTDKDDLTRPKGLFAIIGRVLWPVLPECVNVVTDSSFETFSRSPVEPTTLGTVLSVRGSEACVGLPAPALSDQLRATVGSFLAIAAGRHRLIGVVTEVASDGAGDRRFGAVARVDMMGEILFDASGPVRFSRGVSAYAAIGDVARIIGRDELRLVYKASSDRAIFIGALHNDEAIEACVDIDNLLSKHFAVLGSTGVGKSSGVAVILNEILDIRPDFRIFLLDGHNEYGRCFGARANVVNAANLKLPFWLFNFEEFVDALYYGRPGVEEEVDILAELIPIAKSLYQAHRTSLERATLRRVDPRSAGYTVDTPVPYMIQDLVALIDERMGKLENRASRMRHHHLLARIDGLRNDARYAFMFENANVGGDTMSEILSFLFRLESGAQAMTVLQVAGLPVEVVDAVVSVLCRLAFDFGLWSDGATPMLFLCEEAHRYAAADRSVGFAPTRRALLRIAKEGRKYGVCLGLVTQRPAELDPTIIAQCSTLFAMRMANDRDQALLRSAVTDAAANLVAFVPSLGTREVVGFGEGFPMPTRLKFKSLAADRVPRSETFRRSDVRGEPSDERAFVKAVVERWRGAAGAKASTGEDAEGEVAVRLNASSPLASRMDQIRAQILKR
jgi:DNA helicase HerA-like ATPase